MTASVAQLGLTRGERLQNAKTAFQLKASATPERAAKERIVLVDDVVTTGATLNACANALKTAKFSVIGAVALASADI